VGPTGGLDAVEKGKISCLCQESYPDSLAVQPAVQLLSNKTGGSECNILNIQNGVNETEYEDTEHGTGLIIRVAQKMESSLTS
jgi:hypothetical protein